MADNTTFQSGTLATPPSGLIVAMDEAVINASTVKIQRVKLGIGTDGVYDGDVSSANPLPITGTIAGAVTATVSGTVPTTIQNTPAVTGTVNVANGTVGISGTPPVTIQNSITGTVNVKDGTVGISGSVPIAGTPPVTIQNTPAVTISGTPPVTIQNSITGTVNVLNGTVGVSGSVPIAGTPPVTIQNSITGTVNVLNGTVGISGSVPISGTPPVTIQNTPSITGTVNVLNGTVGISGTVATTIQNTPSITGTVNVANGTVGISGTGQAYVGGTNWNRFATAFTGTQTDGSLVAGTAGSIIVIYDMVISTSAAGYVLLESGTSTREFGEMTFAASGGMVFNSAHGYALPVGSALFYTSNIVGTVGVTINYAKVGTA